jgi:DNA-binding transcriptional ArsR family regulator
VSRVARQSNEPPGGPVGEPVAPRPNRRIGDVQSLQALAHPTRLALMEALALSGTLTATQVSGAVGESPTACAYHLRVLARLGFIEEAGGGHGRERPWRLAQSGLSFSPDDDDPAVTRAARALSEVLIERFIGRIRAFELTRSRFPDDVRAVTGTMQSVVFATPAELAELREQVIAATARYAARLDPALRPPGAQPFEFVTFVHVLNLASQGADDGPAVQDS